MTSIRTSLSGQFDKATLTYARSVFADLREALESDEAVMRRAIDRFEEAIDSLQGDDCSDDQLRTFLESWKAPGFSNSRLRQRGINALREVEGVLDTIIRTNTIHLYEYQIPGTVHGSVGDISQFIVKLEPTE